MARIEFVVSQEEKEAWKVFCNSESLTSSAMLRLIMKKVGSDGKTENESRLGLSKSKRISFELTEADFTKLTTRAELEGFSSRPACVKNLLYIWLDKKPVVNDKEILSLDRSSRELMAIGRNLNQIAHQLNIDYRDSNKVTAELINSLLNRVDLHTEEVAALINRSLNRGEID
jgi:hypothetical protein